MKSIYEGYASFVDDDEKMHDFLTMSMEDFLGMYSYLDEEDYYATYDELMAMSKTRASDSVCCGCKYTKTCFDDSRYVGCGGYVFDGTNPDSYNALSVWAKLNCIDQFINVMNPYMDVCEDEAHDFEDIEYDIKQWIGEQYYIDECGNWYDEGRKVRW